MHVSQVVYLLHVSRFARLVSRSGILFLSSFLGSRKFPLSDINTERGAQYPSPVTNNKYNLRGGHDTRLWTHKRPSDDGRRTKTTTAVASPTGATILSLILSGSIAHGRRYSSSKSTLIARVALFYQSSIQVELFIHNECE